jgi:hypothetical protein
VSFGENSSYLALGKRTPVYGSDGGFIGVVERVECDRRNDIFDGLVLSTPMGQRYLNGADVKAVHEHAVEARIASGDVVGLMEGPVAPTTRTEGVIPTALSWAEIRRWLITRAGLGRVDDPRLHEAEERLQRRQRALRVARENPVLALEAGVGRPDVRGAFHGEVIDLNNANAAAIAGLPGMSHRTATRVCSVRRRVDGFSSLDDFGLVMDLPGDEVERLRGLVVFLPTQDGSDREDGDLRDPPATPA